MFSGRKYLGAGVPLGASATSAPGAVAAPKLGAGLRFSMLTPTYLKTTVSPWIKQRLCEQLLGALAECHQLAGDKNPSLVQIAATVWIRQLPYLRWQISVSSKHHPNVPKSKRDQGVKKAIY